MTEVTEHTRMFPLLRKEILSDLITGKNIFFSSSLILYLYEMMDIHCTYSDNPFTMYVSQIVMLHALNSVKINHTSIKLA